MLKLEKMFTSPRAISFLAALLALPEPVTAEALAAASGTSKCNAQIRLKSLCLLGHMSRARAKVGNNRGKPLEYRFKKGGREAVEAIVKALKEIEPKRHNKRSKTPKVSKAKTKEPAPEAVGYQHPALIAFETRINALVTYYSATLAQLKHKMPTEALKEEVSRVLSFAP